MTLDQIDADLIEPGRLAASVVDALLIERRRPPKSGPVGISAREALIALHCEAQIVVVAAQNVSQGVCLGDDDRARLMVAWARIEAVIEGVG